MKKNNLGRLSLLPGLVKAEHANILLKFTLYVLSMLGMIGFAVFLIGCAILLSLVR